MLVENGPGARSNPTTLKVGELGEAGREEAGVGELHTSSSRGRVSADRCSGAALPSF